MKGGKRNQADNKASEKENSRHREKEGEEEKKTQP
jgi:hypothetical protein